MVPNNNIRYNLKRKHIDTTPLETHLSHNDTFYDDRFKGDDNRKRIRLEYVYHEPLNRSDSPKDNDLKNSINSSLSDSSSNSSPNSKSDNDKSDNDKFIKEFVIALLNMYDDEDSNTESYVDKCMNPYCNHKTYEEDNNPVETIKICKIEDIEDLIRLGKTYHCKKNKDYYGLNLRILCNLVLPLTELRNMIGLKTVKTHIVNQILFFLRGYNKNNKCNECVDCSYGLPCARNLDDMLHTIITGPPGVGKTHLGKILCKVYKETGILSKGHFTLVTRSDFIAKYLGHTAIKTQKLIDKCLGGVMFIDEAYSLCHSDGRDSFSKECLDTLNQNLSEKRDFLCIIAGYRNALDKCFFSMNEGLSRRFTFRYDISGYTPLELMEIFLLKLSQASWEMEFNIKEYKNKEKQKNKLLKFFKSHINDFPNYGGDIETLILNCKIIHCRKIPITTEEIESMPTDDSKYNNKILSLQDINDGYDMYMSFRQGGDKDKSPPPFMYM